jgi:hypothetical protein
LLEEERAGEGRGKGLTPLLPDGSREFAHAFMLLGERGGLVEDRVVWELAACLDVGSVFQLRDRSRLTRK